MKASQLVKELNRLIDKHGDLLVTYAKEEGTAYAIESLPSVGKFNAYPFFSDKQLELKSPNAICIN